MSNIMKGIMLIFLASSSLTCQNREVQEKEARLKSVIENSLGKKLIIPDSLIIYAPFCDYISNSALSLLSNAKFKIYSHINVSCPTCIRDIQMWNDITLNFRKFKTSLILICESDDNFELFKYMHKAGEIKSVSYPFFFDVKREFFKQNQFMKESPQFETVLTDRDNNILLLGNPIRSKKIENIYI